MTFSAPALVLYCADMDLTRSFYSALGLSFARERHGGGPEHHACDLGAFVIELYPSDGRDRGPGPQRLVFSISRLDDALTEWRSLGLRCAGPKRSAYGRTALVADPDGREVLLIEPDDASA